MAEPSLHHDAALEQPARGDDLDDRHGQASAQGQVMISTAMAMVHRLVPVAVDRHPAEEGDEAR